MKNKKIRYKDSETNEDAINNIDNDEEISYEEVTNSSNKTFKDIKKENRSKNARNTQNIIDNIFNFLEFLTNKYTITILLILIIFVIYPLSNKIQYFHYVLNALWLIISFILGAIISHYISSIMK